MKEGSQYVTKRVTVTAVQLRWVDQAAPDVREGDAVPGYEGMLVWVRVSGSQHWYPFALTPSPNAPEHRTRVYVGDWVVTTADGMRYVHDDATFRRVYEPEAAHTARLADATRHVVGSDAATTADALLYLALSQAEKDKLVTYGEAHKRMSNAILRVMEHADARGSR